MVTTIAICPEEVDLGTVQETLLIPLYFRAVESKKENPRIKDDIAIEIIKNIKYDFSKFDSGTLSFHGVISRTIILDREVQNFIDKHPNSVIISIGCGLCTRNLRLDLKNSDWYNVDLSDVMEVRNKYLSTIETNEHYYNISKSCFDESWPKDINAEGKDVLIVIEGVLMYFTEDEIKHLIKIIKDNFKHVTVIAEIMHAMLANRTKYHDTVKKTNAEFKWGIKDCKEIENLDSNIKYITEWNMLDSLSSYNFKFKMMNKIKFLKNVLEKIVLFEISQ
ncbi:polyketide synthesis O-methyltransferase [Piromyces finnis]|uniref:Polyketide synthesis O-methyltransferase n=1 Tax=Piromyces finnis TaxID=1754191 RepID=A0A1Y1VP02_9FUNG|nr:polyketide synthesis O-methyltransferase [Piromyces finnis]|eukprot:ORX61137.1 polyketide synthesis O-methyltransferase [Piromyces finnis]